MRNPPPRRKRAGGWSEPQPHLQFRASITSRQARWRRSPTRWAGGLRGAGAIRTRRSSLAYANGGLAEARQSLWQTRIGTNSHSPILEPSPDRAQRKTPPRPMGGISRSADGAVLGRLTWLMSIPVHYRSCASPRKPTREQPGTRTALSAMSPRGNASSRRGRGTSLRR